MKDSQARTGNNKTISDHQTFNGKTRNLIKARRFMEANQIQRNGYLGLT